MDGFTESQSTGALTVFSGENARKTKRRKGKSQSKCKERPPKVLLVFSYLKSQLVALYMRDFSSVEQGVQRLHFIIRTFEEDFRRASGAITNASVVEVAGGLMVGLGLLLAPAHRGASALITGAGVAGLSGAAIADKVWNKKIMGLQDKLIRDADAAVKEIQNKISPMMDAMREISRQVHEILTDLSYPERDVGYLNKYFSSAGELVRFLQIYDISVLAGQITSQTCLIGNRFIGALPIRTALEMMWIEIFQLQNAMEEITKTIDRIADQPD